MSEKNYCPNCGRHCDLNNPQCKRGEEYIRTENIVKNRHFANKSKNTYDTLHHDMCNIDNKLIMNLRDLGHMIRFLFEGKGSQKRILIILYEAGSMTQRELTERLGVQPGSASEVIRKLENAGLILRKQSQTDRRTTDIQLTESGQTEAEKAVRQRQIRHQEMFSCLSIEEKEILLALIEKLNTDWDNRYRENDKKMGCIERHRKKYDSHGHRHDFRYH